MSKFIELDKLDELDEDQEQFIKDCEDIFSDKYSKAEIYKYIIDTYYR